MEQQSIDDEPRSAQVLYRGVEERFEAVQDEVSLLKLEIKQTLIDLREFMMKGHEIASPSVFDGPQAHHLNGLGDAGQERFSPPTQASPDAPPAALPDDPSTAPDAPPAALPDDPSTAPAPQDAGGYKAGYSMDGLKMGHIIGWLGTVASRGLSPRQLKPFLQAYEQSGHLTPAMAALTYKSLEELEGIQGGQFNQSPSPSEYSQCLLELHEIITNPGYSSTYDAPAPRSKRVASAMQYPVSAPPEPQGANPRRPARRAMGNGSKRKQVQPVQPSVNPGNVAGRDPLVGNRHNG